MFADGDGRITGPDAIKFFGMSKLSRPDLKQVRCLSLLIPFLALFCLRSYWFLMYVPFLSNRAAIQGLGYLGHQTAGVPGFP